jgi:thioredoxin reductase (NADPH)
MEPSSIHDVIIIGGGPAGLSAGIYTCRDRLNTLLIEKALIGGMINQTELLENYPGFVDGIGGTELTSLMYRQAQRFGLNDINAEVIAIEPKGDKFIIKTSDKNFIAGAVIIAGGSDKQKMNIPGEKEFTGRGVSYCATCDAPFYNNKTVAVVGGGNTALYEALHLAKFASKVILIHRRGEFRATNIVQEHVKKEPKIQFLMNTIVEAARGNTFLEKLLIKDVISGKQSEIKVDGVFVAIGLKPNTEYLKGLIEMDPQGMILANDKMETSVRGIFAAGDIRHNSIRQVISAAADGATAAINAKNWLETG